MVRVRADVGSHAHQLVDVAETSAEDVLGHDADTVRQRQQDDEQRFVVGRDPRIRKRRDVGGMQTVWRHGPQPVGRRRDAHAHLAELVDEHVHVIGPCAVDGDLAPGDTDRREEGGRFDAVGDDHMVDRVQRLDTFDGDRRGTGAEHASAHSVQERGEVGDLGFASGIVDDRRSLGED